MKTLLAKPTIKIIAVDYLDDVGPTPVYVGRAEINGIAVVFDVCNNRCDYLELFDSPDIPISKIQNINSLAGHVLLLEFILQKYYTTTEKEMTLKHC